MQYLAKLLPKLSEKTDRLRKLLKKKELWNWGEEPGNDFNQIKHADRETMSSERTMQKTRIIW